MPDARRGARSSRARAARSRRARRSSSPTTRRASSPRASCRRLLPLARRRRLPVLVDPKVPPLPALQARRARHPEPARGGAGHRHRASAGAAELLAAGRALLKRLDCRAVLVTRGEQGMSLFERGRPPVHIPTAAREVFDVTGAGDSVIATLALALCAGSAAPRGRRPRELRGGGGRGQAGNGLRLPGGGPGRGGSRAREGRRRGRRTRGLPVRVAPRARRGVAGRLRRLAPAREALRRRPHRQGARPPAAGPASRPSPRTPRRGLPVRIGRRRMGGRRARDASSRRRAARARRLAPPPRGRSRRPSRRRASRSRRRLGRRCAPRADAKSDSTSSWARTARAASCAARSCSRPRPRASTWPPAGTRAAHPPCSCASRPASPATCGSSPAPTTWASASARRSPPCPRRSLVARLEGEAVRHFPALLEIEGGRYAHTIPSPSADPGSLLEIAGAALGAPGRRRRARRPHHRRGDLLRAALRPRARGDAALPIPPPRVTPSGRSKTSAASF